MSETSGSYEETEKEFLLALKRQLTEVKGEVSERNEDIVKRDGYIYGDLLDQSLDIPIGHDFTPVNWLRRTVEIHKTQFMGRPFQLISTYDTKDESSVEDPKDKDRLKIENSRQKTFAELRKQTIDDIIRDNGGHSLFMEGAESASAIGSWVVKAWYDDDAKRFVLSPVEAVENCYAVWDKDDFRQYGLFAYVYQIRKQKAAELYGCEDDVVTSKLGDPLGSGLGIDNPSPSNDGQPMVTVLEATGKVEGWCVKGGKLYKCDLGDETEVNVLAVGDEIKRLEYDEKKLPRYYIFPNRKERRRPWGKSDISDAAISINQTYVETLSDWRTVASKVNFPKFKGFNFGVDTTLPKFKSRTIQLLPLADGQDIVPLNQGDANQIDFRAQMEEEKEQFVRETGISRVLFDDPSITLNSNQALLTSMKPTSDIAENKKQLWGPILVQMFDDALRTIAAYDETLKDLVDDTDPWNLKVQWPSVMQKEDPVYQQMLLNRFNGKTMSLQSYLEAQGESKEEIDRIRDELSDPVTAAILGNVVNVLAEQLVMPPQQPETPNPVTTANVSIKGETLRPELREALAMEAVNNPQALQPEQAQPQSSQSPQQAPIATQANNTEGTQPVSQPGSGATSTGAQGAINQTNQQQGA